MRARLFSLGATNSQERSELAVYGGIVLALHVAGLGLAWVAAAAHPFMLGLAGLAYSFGLRHAFDADHIAAIDNSTRKLMGAPRRPLGVGFFFSLGHSTVVFGLTVAIVLAARTLAGDLPALRSFGAVVGTTVSGVFLYLIGFLNLMVMLDLLRVFRQMRRGHYDAAALERRLHERGWMSRWLGGLFRLVSRPRQLYWIGLLFGLGFDTATEVGLLTSAGVAASQALPIGAVLSLPLAFAAGMTLMDTADGVMMCGAYGWALSNPLRKVFYNLTLTGLSVMVALFVGTIELVSIVTGHLLDLHTGIWGLIQDLDFQTMGYAVAGLFAVSWLGSLAIWHFGRVEERWIANRES